jgi:CheY-like chemotaxis protein/HPt (histidine-containing phosphotransfer) domain-containing protein
MNPGYSVDAANLNPTPPENKSVALMASPTPEKYLIATPSDNIKSNRAATDVNQNWFSNIQTQIPACNSPVRILVADDNLLVRTCMMNLLDQWKMNYAICKNGQQAWQLLHQEVFDLVLIDLQMPVMDGHEVVARLRAATDNPNQHIPMIALAGSEDAAAKERMFTAGINAYLTKPFQPGILFQTINNYTAVPDHLQTHLFADMLDPQVLHDLYADDYEQLDLMFHLFLHHTPNSLQAMTAALHQQDWIALEQEVHKIKPTFAMVGMQKITEMAGKLEETLNCAGHLSKTAGVEFLQFKGAIQEALNAVLLKKELIQNFLKE